MRAKLVFNGLKEVIAEILLQDIDLVLIFHKFPLVLKQANLSDKPL